MRWINQETAKEIDLELMNPEIGGFSIDQLMELAGLSVAESIAQVYSNKLKVLILCGESFGHADADAEACYDFEYSFILNPLIPKGLETMAGMDLFVLGI